MLEEERKYEVAASFTLPDLTDCVPEDGRLIVRPATKLRATYYDTVDLRLARAGASLRYRRGDDEPWTVKIPTDAPGIRNEISLSGPQSTIPGRLLELVTGYTRGAALAPVTTLNTIRQAYQVCDRDDRVAVEVVDDMVTVSEGKRTVLKFREIEAERKAGKARLLDRVEVLLRDAGATVTEGFTPKHVRALGPPATRPPDWPEPPAKLSKRPTAGDVVTMAIQRDIARIVAHDPLVRLRAQVGRDDTAVHQMRVGCRRLRSDLRTFAGLIDRDWAGTLRGALGWIADALGVARDAEVLRARLRRTAQTDPLVPLDGASVARIDADLAARHEDALQTLDKVMCEERYHQLLDLLLEAAAQPRLTEAAAGPAEAVLAGLVAKPWRRFADGGNGVVGAAHLDPNSPDQAWHAVRVNGKRARYAVEAVAGVIGGEAAALASALADVQDLLGEHQDAAVAADTWLSIANADPDDFALAITAGRLYERERTTLRAIRAAFPLAWRVASRRRLIAWMT
jgi:CHAD domain-containing protein